MLETICALTTTRLRRASRQFCKPEDYRSNCVIWLQRAVICPLGSEIRHDAVIVQGKCKSGAPCRACGDNVISSWFKRKTANLNQEGNKKKPDWGEVGQ